MPIYTFYNKKTKKQFDDMMSIAEMEEYLNKNELVRVLKFPGIVANQGSLLSKTDQGWKDNLKRIKAGSAKNNTIKV